MQRRSDVPPVLLGPGGQSSFVIEINKDHPGFDMALEILCSLPLDGSPIPMKLLADDFGFGLQSELRLLLDKLKNRRYSVQTMTISKADGGSRGCHLAGDRLAAKVDAESYWHRVYGDQDEHEKQ